MSIELARQRIDRLGELQALFLSNDQTIRDDPEVNSEDDYFKEDIVYMVQEEYDDARCSYEVYINSLKPASEPSVKIAEPSPAFDL